MTQMLPTLVKAVNEGKEYGRAQHMLDTLRGGKRCT